MEGGRIHRPGALVDLDEAGLVAELAQYLARRRESERGQEGDVAWRGPADSGADADAEGVGPGRGQQDRALGADPELGGQSLGELGRPPLAVLEGAAPQRALLAVGDLVGPGRARGDDHRDGRREHRPPIGGNSVEGGWSHSSTCGTARPRATARPESHQPATSGPGRGRLDDGRTRRHPGHDEAGQVDEGHGRRPEVQGPRHAARPRGGAWGGDGGGDGRGDVLGGEERAAGAGGGHQRAATLGAVHEPRHDPLLPRADEVGEAEGQQRSGRADRFGDEELLRTLGHTVGPASRGVGVGQPAAQRGDARRGARAGPGQRGDLGGPRAQPLVVPRELAGTVLGEGPGGAAVDLERRRQHDPPPAEERGQPGGGHDVVEGQGPALWGRGSLDPARRTMIASGASASRESSGPRSSTAMSQARKEGTPAPADAASSAITSAITSGGRWRSTTVSVHAPRPRPASLVSS